MGLGNIIKAIITADNKEFNDKIKQTEGRLKSFVSNVSAKMAEVGKKLQSIGSSMTKWITLPIMGAGAASIKFASDYEESMNKVDVAFKGSAGQVREFAKTALRSFGIAEGTALDMAALFGDMATSMGLTTDKAADMSISLTGLAGDLASFKNIRIEEAMTALNGVFTGETESLKRLGIVMTEANVEAFALSEGIQKNIRDMTQAEKVQLRYAYIINQTTNAQGDFERTGGAAANQMRIFTEGLKQLAQQFGEVLLPAFTKIVTKVNEVIGRFSELDKGAKKIIVVIAGVVAGIGPLLFSLGAFLKIIPVLRAGLISLRTAALGPLGAAIIALTGAWKLYNFEQQKTKRLAGELSEKSLPELEKMAEQAKNKLDKALGEAGAGTSIGFSMDVAGATNPFAAMINQARKALGATSDTEVLIQELTAIKQATELVKARGKEEANVNAELEKQLSNIFDVNTGLLDGLNIAQEFEGTVPDGWAEWFEAIGDGAFNVKEHLQATEDAINALWEPSAVFKEIDESVKALDETFEKLADPEKFETPINYLQMLGWAAEDFGNAIMQAGIMGSNSLKDFVANVKSAAKQTIAAFIAEATAAMVRNAILASTKLGPLGLLLAPVAAAAAGGIAAGLFSSAIPAFAQGGAVSGATLAMVGEGAGVSRSNPEYIGTADQLAKMGGGGTLTARVSRGDLLFILNEGDVHANRTF